LLPCERGHEKRGGHELFPAGRKNEWEKAEGMEREKRNLFPLVACILHRARFLKTGIDRAEHEQRKKEKMQQNQIEAFHSVPLRFA
jgi:hypothetical protein